MPRFFSCVRLLSLVLALGAVPAVRAQLVVPQIFSTGAVLQRDKVLPVWGHAEAGSTVTVTFDGTAASTAAGTDGRWRLELPARGAGGPYAMTVASGAQSFTYSDVYLGDVYLASGQSNIEWTVSQSDNASAVVAAANDPLIREFKVPKGLANDPADDLPAGSRWRSASPSTVGAFSAVGYYAARDLRRARPDVPVAILNVTYGGSRIETWMSDAMLGFDESVRLANGEPERQPTLAYNKMIHPILNVRLKGFLWYQGESNADNLTDANAYGALFRTMIAGWRGVFGQGDLPFVWVQLPNFGAPQTVAQGAPPTYNAWPDLRAGQSSALALPNTAEVVTIETGNLGSNGQVDIHPTNKEPVGVRVALAIRRLVYGDDVVASGPRYRSNVVRPDGSVAIRYDNVGGGLANADGTLNGFTIAPETGNFVWATARIEGDQVIVSSPSVTAPGRVRYAWQYNPGGRGTPGAADLTNAEGLPAAPFEAVVQPAFGITSFGASSPTIAPGQSTVLSWTTVNASLVTLNGVAVAANGSQTVSPTATTTYTLAAVNADDASDTATRTVTITVGTSTRYEAESASFTGGSDSFGHVPLARSPLASGGAYLDLREAWTITFPNYVAQTAGTYTFNIGYLLNYESPKVQNLVVNGTSTPVTFTAPNTTTFREIAVQVPLVAGANTVQIVGSYNYMSVDYLEVVQTTGTAGEAAPAAETGARLDAPQPNPSRASTALRYTLERDADVRLDVYDTSGRLVATLADGRVAAGDHRAVLDTSGLAGGVYVVQLRSGAGVRTQRLVVVR